MQRSTALWSPWALSLLSALVPLLAMIVTWHTAAAAEPSSGSTGAAPAPSAAANEVNATIDRALAFLVKDAAAWKAEHNCASCHHASLIVWSLREAKARGRTVDEPTLAELTEWISEGSGTTGVPRPASAPRAFNSKAVQFALGLAADPQPGEAARAGLQRMLKTIESDQLEDGSWVAWPETRPPFFGPSNETMSALAVLALLSEAAAGDEAARAARDKGVAWLAANKNDDDPQSIAVRLMIWRRMDRPASEIEPLISRLRERQNADGGWSQAADMPSDAWATGQALYALSLADLKSEDPVIARGQGFLIRTQREDGSWPMTSRPIPPNGAGATSLIPITGAGSAWAVIGLARTR